MLRLDNPILWAIGLVGTRAPHSCRAPLSFAERTIEAAAAQEPRPGCFQIQPSDGQADSRHQKIAAASLILLTIREASFDQDTNLG